MEPLIPMIERSPRELHADCRRGYAGLAQRTPALVVAGFDCGARLLVLIPGTETELAFIPEFHRVWWRAVHRWTPSFPRVSELAAELSRLGPRRTVPFFAAATSAMERWRPVWNGACAGLDDHVEFVIPADDVAQHRAHAFLSRWVSEFSVAAAVDPAGSGTAAIDALCAAPRGLDGDDDQALLRRAVAAMERMERRGRGSLRASERRIFPNLLELMLPPTLGADRREAWSDLLDRRARWVADSPVPEDYPSIQSLTSSSESEREFVHEADPQRMRGTPLVGRRGCVCCCRRG